MRPDFRFVLGAFLAIALLAVAGLGLVTSVRLVQEARINPIEDARSLAFAGPAQWNQFYDPEGARRFEDLAGKAPAATEARLETPADTAELAPPAAAPAAVPEAVPPEAPQEETASLPARQPDPVIGAVDAPSIAGDKPPASDPPPADPAQLPETATDVSVAAPPAPAAVVPAPEVPALPGAGAPSNERVASAPATAPESDLRQEPAVAPPTEPQAEPQAPAEAETTVDPLPTPPTPRARPKPSFRRRIVRGHIHRVAPVSQQTTQNSGFPPSPAWPSYDNQLTGASATKKNAGKLTGTLTNRPQ